MKKWICYGNCEHNSGCELECDDEIQPSGCIHQICAEEYDDVLTDWVEI